MRIILVFLMLWAGPALSFEPDPNGPLKTRAIAFTDGVKAPNGRLTDENGDIHRLNRLRGEVSIVTMWTTLCHICRTEMPALARLADKLKGTRIKIRPVNVENPKHRTAYILRHMEVSGIDNLPLLRDLDFEVWKRVGAKGTPTTIIIDSFGQVVAAVTGGHMDWHDPEVIDYLQALAASPDAQSSRALLAGS